MSKSNIDLGTYLGIYSDKISNMCSNNLNNHFSGTGKPSCISFTAYKTSWEMLNLYNTIKVTSPMPPMSNRTSQSETYLDRGSALDSSPLTTSLPVARAAETRRRLAATSAARCTSTWCLGNQLPATLRGLGVILKRTGFPWGEPVSLYRRDSPGIRCYQI